MEEPRASRAAAKESPWPSELIHRVPAPPHRDPVKGFSFQRTSRDPTAVPKLSAELPGLASVREAVSPANQKKRAALRIFRKRPGRFGKPPYASESREKILRRVPEFREPREPFGAPCRIPGDAKRFGSALQGSASRAKIPRLARTFGETVPGSRKRRSLPRAVPLFCGPRQASASRRRIRKSAGILGEPLEGPMARPRIRSAAPRICKRRGIILMGSERVSRKSAPHRPAINRRATKAAPPEGGFKRALLLEAGFIRRCSCSPGIHARAQGAT